MATEPDWATLIEVSQRFLLEQAAIDASEDFFETLLDQSPLRPAMGEFLFHLLRILESMSAFSQGRPAIPRIAHCEQNRRAFLEAPGGAIRDRLSFASHLLFRFAVQAGAMSAPDAKEFERRIEAALQDTS